tara:strand:- start:29 stop:361 length:333 start_codon:yes stop_codon:yes gene_type:complete
MQPRQGRPVFNVFHQNALLNNNIIVAMNPEMAEEIISLIRECCSTDSGLENRNDYPHLYGFSDRLRSNLDWSKMQKLRSAERKNGNTGLGGNGVDSFLNNVDGEQFSSVG